MLSVNNFCLRRTQRHLLTTLNAVAAAYKCHLQLVLQISFLPFPLVFFCLFYTNHINDFRLAFHFVTLAALYLAAEMRFSLTFCFQQRCLKRFLMAAASNNCISTTTNRKTVQIGWQMNTDTNTHTRTIGHLLHLFVDSD